MQFLHVYSVTDLKQVNIILLSNYFQNTWNSVIFTDLEYIKCILIYRVMDLKQISKLGSYCV
jgi:hypothetical protein